MWKKSLLRGVFSYSTSVTVTLLVSLIAVLSGAPRMCTEEFIARAGGELQATLLQPLLIGLIGFAFGSGSVLFELEKWSFLKQGVVHFALTAVVWIAVELVCFRPVAPPVVISFSVSVGGTYAITWGVQYFVWRDRVRTLNEQIHRRNGGEE